MQSRLALLLSLLLSAAAYSRAQTRATTTTIPPDDVQCGTELCFLNLDEVCVPHPNRCQCRFGYARSTAGEQCVETAKLCDGTQSTETRIQPLMSTPSTSLNKEIFYETRSNNTILAFLLPFLTHHCLEIGQQFGQTSIRPSYITTDTLFINPPHLYNSSRQEGLMFNFSVALNKNHGLTDICELWGQLVDSLKTSDLRIGSGPLYIAADHPNVCPPPKCGNRVCDARLGEVCIDKRACDCPVGLGRAGPGERCQSTNTACLDNDCHPLASCIERGRKGPDSYACRCPDGFLDQDRFNPGRTCVRLDIRNECERPESNECHAHAMCVDLTQGYECRCLPGRKDVSAPGARPGTTCSVDYCADLWYCPQNTTCVNREREGVCLCLEGFIDIRASDKRTSLLTWFFFVRCLHPRDVDECALTLTDCSGIATCVDQVDGYDCKCPDGYTDGSPQNPGRICAAAACGLCGGRGSCVHDVQTRNVTCACHDGYSGAFCEVSNSSPKTTFLTIFPFMSAFFD